MAADRAETTKAHPTVRVIRRDDLPRAQSEATLNGAVAAEADVAILEVTGPGVVPCIQGLLTNDVEAPGPHGFVYGAVLTPKGMIISDLWAGRRDTAMTLFPPSRGREELLAAFGRSLPPRLARVADDTAAVAVIRLVGPLVPELLVAGRIQIPEPGRQLAHPISDVPCVLARPRAEQPFVLQITMPKTESEHIKDTLQTLGVTIVSPAALELARIKSGWPSLGAEIDGKTLPQEVRFDEIEGVSYSKGCYTGQETVARVHFRGHTNRHLTGLRWTDDEPNPGTPEIRRGEKVVGHVTSIAWIPQSDQPIGLGLVRREVSTGEAVTAAGAPALTVELPQ